MLPFILLLVVNCNPVKNDNVMLVINILAWLLLSHNCLVWFTLHHWAHQSNAKRFMNRFLCTSFGLGLLPKAPGTWGSLLPLFFCLGMWTL